MGKLVNLKLEGNFKQGFRATLEIGTETERPAIEISAELPKFPELETQLNQWQEKYRQIGAPYRIKPKKITYDGSVNQRIEECLDSAKKLRSHFSNWLNSEPFRPIDKCLREELNRDEAIKLLIRTENPQLQKLPWHLWDLLERYPQAEVALSGTKFARAKKIAPPSHKNKIRILAILGHKEGINVEADRQLLKKLPHTETVFLVEPPSQVLNDKLWEQPWDILFFAGHSETEGETGRIYINPEESLTIDELWYALRKAVERGLKLAIFNSCDGLGLARRLDDLQIPQMIVMRELVPDKVAQEFLKYFLIAFIGGRPFYLAVREARERLQGLEKSFPCATWLPVICQNPSEMLLTWEELLPNRKKLPFSRFPLAMHNWQAVLVASVLVTSLILGVRSLGWLQAWELQVFDQFMRLRGDETPDSRLLILEVTEEDIRKYGWPLPDAILAQVLEKLETYQPRVIGLNIYRDLAVGSGNSDFLQRLQSNPSIIAVCKGKDVNDSGVLPPPNFPTHRLGFNDVVEDSDAIVRRYLFAMSPEPNSPCPSQLSFSLQVALQYLAAENIKPQYTSQKYLKLGNTVFKTLNNREGIHHKADLWGHQVLLNYRSHQFPKNMAQRMSISEVLNNQIKAQIFQDRIVLIGVTGVSVKDDFNTPYRQKLRGLLLQAQMVSQILSAVQDGRSLLWIWPWWGEILWIWGGALIGSILAAYYRSSWQLKLAASMAVLSVYALCFGIFIQGGVAPLVPSIFALIAACSSVAAYITYTFRNPQ